MVSDGIRVDHVRGVSGVDSQFQADGTWRSFVVPPQSMKIWMRQEE
jgi:hypothetical protein